MNQKSFPVAVLSILIGVCAFVFAQDQAPAPNFSEGDFWQFKVTEKGFIGYSSEAGDAVYELVYSQSGIKMLRLFGDQKEELDRQASFPVLALLGLSKGQEDLRFPLSLGQKWTYEYKFTPRGARRANVVSVEISVMGSEDVTTPAGTFRALRIHKDEGWSRPGGGRTQQITTYFYSPQTKSIVKSKMESEDGARREVELIKYGSVR